MIEPWKQMTRGVPLTARAVRPARRLPSDPIMNALYRAIDARDLSVREVSRVSGLDTTTLARWRVNQGRPGLFSVTCLANALGFDVVLTPKPKKP